jgi:hypothetical protein
MRYAFPAHFIVIIFERCNLAGWLSQSISAGRAAYGPEPAVASSDVSASNFFGRRSLYFQGQSFQVFGKR